MCPEYQNNLDSGAYEQLYGSDTVGREAEGCRLIGCTWSNNRCTNGGGGGGGGSDSGSDSGSGSGASQGSGCSANTDPYVCSSVAGCAWDASAGSSDASAGSESSDEDTVIIIIVVVAGLFFVVGIIAVVIKMNKTNKPKQESNQPNLQKQLDFATPGRPSATGNFKSPSSFSTPAHASKPPSAAGQRGARSAAARPTAAMIMADETFDDPFADVAGYLAVGSASPPPPSEEAMGYGFGDFDMSTLSPAAPTPAPMASTMGGRAPAIPMFAAAPAATNSPDIGAIFDDEEEEL